MSNSSNQVRKVSWADIIPTYLLFYDDYFRGKGLGLTHLLFVEGKTDTTFLSKFFETPVKDENGSYIDMRISQDKIIKDFSMDLLSPLSLGNVYECYFYANHNTRITLSNEQKSKRENYLNMHDYRAFKFPIEIINSFINNNYTNIDCFGFIDRDFRQNESYYNNLLRPTEMHDRETTFLRYCLPKYLDYVNDKQKAINVVKKIANFCIKQGIYEEKSLEYSNTHRKCDLTFFILQLSKNYFEQAKDNPIECLNIEFNSHIDNAKTFALENTRFTDGTYNEESVNSFINECNIEIKNFYISYSDEFISNTIDKWLYDDNVQEIKETSFLNELFRKANGHIIVSLLLRSEFNNKLNGIEPNVKLVGRNSSVEEDFTDFLVKRTKKRKAVTDEKINILYQIEPFVNYKKYRQELESRIIALQNRKYLNNI